MKRYCDYCKQQIYSGIQVPRTGEFHKVCVALGVVAASVRKMWGELPHGIVNRMNYRRDSALMTASYRYKSAYEDQVLDDVATRLLASIGEL